MEVPNKYRGDGISCHSNGDQHQRQAPDLDVVGKEDHHAQEHDGRQPCTGGVDALRIVDRVRNRQAEVFCERSFFSEAFGNEFRTLAGDLIDQTHGFDFHHIGQRNTHRS